MWAANVLLIFPFNTNYTILSFQLENVVTVLVRKARAVKSRQIASCSRSQCDLLP